MNNAGELMPSSPPGLYQCGTSYHIWLNGRTDTNMNILLKRKKPKNKTKQKNKNKTKQKTKTKTKTKNKTKQNKVFAIRISRFYQFLLHQNSIDLDRPVK